ncbi:MAG: S8 family serine peptidase [Paludibacter sp.]|nr:S8 family serine peptidase [Paludibacter sp.]
MKRIIIYLVLLSIIVFVEAQDRNNQDGVIKVDQQSSRYNCVQNELLVKFKSGTVATMVKSGPSKIISGISTVDRVLGQYDLQEVEQLLPNDNPNRVMRKAKAYSGETVTETSLNQLYRVKVSTTSVKTNFELIEELKALPEVEFAEPNYIVSVLGEPVQDIKTIVKQKTIKDENPSVYTSEPMYTMQWGIPTVKLDALWQRPVTVTKRPVIAIIDTGVDTEHPDLKDNIWTNPGESSGSEGVDDDGNGFKDDVHGWDFVNQTANVKDFNSHGTHCAGIAAAVSNNELGITGADPNALIMAISVMQSNGSGDVATLIKGINYAAHNGADIISMSIGTYGYSIALEQALAQAYQSAVLVAAAGNDGVGIYDPCRRDFKKGGPLYPGAFTFVLGVQASQQDISQTTGSHLSAWSNYDCDGPVYSGYSEEKLYNYELLAPGANIISTVPGGQYRTFNGTSMATPLVAGGISALMERKEFVSQELLWSTLLQSANENVDFDAAYTLIPKPELNIVAMETNDTLSGDKDMRPDAGEYMDIYPTIRNSGGNVDSVYFQLTFDEFEDTTTVKILNDSVSLGYSLTSYAKMKSKSPIRIKINPNVVDGRNIKLVLKAWYGNHEGEVSQKLLLNVENGVELKGMLTEDMTLTPDKNYIVTSSLAIPSGVTLTIRPGVIIKFREKTSISSKGVVIAIGKPDSLISFTKSDLSSSWDGITLTSWNDKIRYCLFEYCSKSLDMGLVNIEHCIFKNNFSSIIGSGYKLYSNLTNNVLSPLNAGSSFYSNVINNQVYGTYLGLYSDVPGWNSGANNSNVFSNYSEAYLANCSYYSQYKTPTLISHLKNYWGASKEKIIRKSIIDFASSPLTTFGMVDLSVKAVNPYSEAHGIVWKVLVNGFDAQDAFDSIPPLGVGRHKFVVYFNRPMNKNFPPMIAMGVRPPYTQSVIGEDGSWNEGGNIYTAYYTVKAVGTGEGLNRIYVANAKDDENFEIPFENQRFNVIVQAAGSMSNGFEATAGLGKVELKWERPEGYFDDLLGYNMYRYTYVNDSVCSDTTLVNPALITDTVYTDYNVVPGKTYNYMYKVLRTNLTENEYSKVVSSKALTASKGDANGSLAVDVADVVTTVNYVTNQNPQPFIFDAADVNTDKYIDVLDIVGIINIILNPKSPAPDARISSSAIYSIENGILYVESPVALGGVQFKIHANKDSVNIQTLEALNGFEQASQWLNDSTYLLLAYSLSAKEISNGKNALLRLGEGTSLMEIVLSDTNGSNIIAVNNNTTNLIKTEGNQLLKVYPNPFTNTINISYSISNNNYTDVEVFVTDISGRIISVLNKNSVNNGCYTFSWSPVNILSSGIYFCSFRVNGKIIQTEKLIYLKE